LGPRTSYPFYWAELRIPLLDKSGVRREALFVTEIAGLPDPREKIRQAGYIGRDILCHFRFVYDGTTGQVELIKP
jgi:hypothetical protein